MRYTVISSSPDVDDELTMIWLLAADRAAVTRAADEIDRRLKFSPLTSGTDLGDYWGLTVDPLTVTYTVSPDDCLVTILHYGCAP
jgi:hypothetical protein